MLNLNKHFGKNLKIKNKNSTIQLLPTDEELFIESVNLLENCWNKSNILVNDFGINIIDFETDYHQIIENLFLIKYGLLKTEIILWYAFGRFDENNKTLPLILQHEDKDDEQVYLNNAKELWDFLNKIEEETDNDK
jgi:hypothetical protein